MTGPIITADIALHELMTEADLYRVGRGTYRVAPVNRQSLDTLIEAMGATEDLEDNNDAEPSIGPWDDRESDGNCDDEPDHDGEPSLCGVNFGHGDPLEREPEYGMGGAI